MLEKVRKPGRTKSIVAYVVFGAIILVFALFGVNPDKLGGAKGGGMAATVNDRVISLLDFREKVQRVESQMQINSLPNEQKQNATQMVRRRALEELISVEVLSLSAQKQGVVISDDEIRERITQYPVFQEEGTFRRDLYSRYLEYSKVTPGDFEDKVRKEIAIGRMQNLFVSAASPVVGELDRNLQLDSTKVELDYVTFDKEQLERAIQVPKKTISDFLANPENEKKLKDYYEMNLSEFSTPEEVRARHILIAPNAEEKISDKDAQAKAQMVLERLKKGEKFESLAKELSVDLGSAKNGGDLGYFARGRMVPEFEAAAFKAAKGQITDVVKTQFGYHIIKVEDHREAKTSPFAEVRETIANRELAKTQAPQKLEQLTQLVKNGQEAELSKELKALQWTWEKTGEFDLGQEAIPGLGENEKVLKLVLALKKDNGLVNELIESQGRYHIVRLGKIKTQPIEKDEMSSERMMGRMAAYRRSAELLNYWIRKEREEYDIKRNMELLAQ